MISDAFVGVSSNSYSMNAYVLLHFEHKTNVTSIINIHRATYRWLVAPNKKFDNDYDAISKFKT